MFFRQENKENFKSNDKKKKKSSDMELSDIGTILDGKKTNTRYGNTENYLSFSFQAKHIQTIQSELIKHIDQNTSYPLKNLSPFLTDEDLISDLSTLSQNIKQVTEDYLEICKDEKSHDNQVILKYLTELQKVFTRIAPDIRGAAAAASKVLEFYLENLKYVTEINIYKVEVPRDKYKKMQRFYLDGEDREVFLKTLKGFAGLAGGLGATILQNFLGDKLSGYFAASLNPPRSEILLNKSDADSQSWQCSALTSKGNISAEWIENRVDWKPEHLADYRWGARGAPVPAPSSDKTKVLYFVDCQNPNEIFKNGTTYTLDNAINPDGYIIFFEELYLAVQFAMIPEIGRRFDIVGGWHKHKPWTIEERAEIRGKLTNEVQKCTPLPTVIVTEVIEYLAPRR